MERIGQSDVATILGRRVAFPFPTEQVHFGGCIRSSSHRLETARLRCQKSRGRQSAVHTQAEQHQLMRKAFHYATPKAWDRGPAKRSDASRPLHSPFSDLRSRHPCISRRQSTAGASELGSDWKRIGMQS